ncbi:hypothetical protein BKA62DRAFT_696806 [Auriculariales sp. MPI-PUGE-AT-0066]|nr:hypothetical protein BKA62DRAFT_696806 [Auriculariales sp. MPI-PUGE-AT-0066]
MRVLFSTATLLLSLARLTTAQLEQFHVYTPTSDTFLKNGEIFNITWFAPHSGVGDWFFSTPDFKFAIPLLKSMALYHPNETDSVYNYVTVMCPGVPPGTYTVVLDYGGWFYSSPPFGVGAQPDLSTTYSEPFTKGSKPSDMFDTIRGSPTIINTEEPEETTSTDGTSDTPVVTILDSTSTATTSTSGSVSTPSPSVSSLQGEATLVTVPLWSVVGAAWLVWAV